MGRCSKGQTFRDRLLDSDELEPAVRNDISKNSCDDDAHDGHGHDPSGFLRYAHSDRCGDGLWKQGYIVHMFQLKDHGHHIDADNTSDDTRGDRRRNSRQVFLQQLQLLVKRDREAYRRRGQKIADIGRSLIIIRVCDPRGL